MDGDCVPSDCVRCETHRTCLAARWRMQPLDHRAIGQDNSWNCQRSWQSTMVSTWAWCVAPETQPARRPRGCYQCGLPRRCAVRVLGAALVEAVIDWARSNGVTRLLLDVADHNTSAIALYACKGFAPTDGVATFPPPREHI